MRIPNENAFLKKAELSKTNMKYYRVVGNKIQMWMWKNNVFLFTDVVDFDSNFIIDMSTKYGFVEGLPTEQEAKEWGLDD